MLNLHEKIKIVHVNKGIEIVETYKKVKLQK